MTLGPLMFACDIDFVEYRLGRGVVAVYGVTGNLNDERHIRNSLPMILERTKLEREALKEIAMGMKIMCYYVIHTKDLSRFLVLNLLGDQYDRFMTQDEYKQFIKDL